jgi:hypothetical protein
MDGDVSTRPDMNQIACQACLERAGCEAQEGMVFTCTRNKDMICGYCGAEVGTIHLFFCQPKGWCWEDERIK